MGKRRKYEGDAGAREQREAGTDCKVEQGKVGAVGEGLLGEGGKAEKGEQGKGGSYQERTRKLWLLWPSRTRRSEQNERGLRVEREELVKRENKQLDDEEKRKNEKELAQMLDENEVEMVALIAKQE